MKNLNATVCNCGQVFIPSKDRCIKCSGNTEPLALMGYGTILTYTILHTVTDGLESTLILGLIEIDTPPEKPEIQPPRLVCVGELEKHELEIGAKVKIIKNEGKYYFKSLHDN